MTHLAALRATKAAEVWDDERVLVQAARTDRAAFGVLYQRFYPQVYRFLHARLDGVEEAADLTQQVFVRALTALPGYRERGLPFAAWLFRIARNAAIDAARRQRHASAQGHLPDGASAGDTGDPERHALRHEAMDRLQVLLRGLDPERRDLLALRFAAGLTAREIAAVVGGGEAAVQKRLARTIRTLKEQYDDTP